MLRSQAIVKRDRYIRNFIRESEQRDWEFYSAFHARNKEYYKTFSAWPPSEARGNALARIQSHIDWAESRYPCLKKTI